MRTRKMRWEYVSENTGHWRPMVGIENRHCGAPCLSSTNGSIGDLLSLSIGFPMKDLGNDELHFLTGEINVRKNN